MNKGVNVLAKKGTSVPDASDSIPLEFLCVGFTLFLWCFGVRYNALIPSSFIILVVLVVCSLCFPSLLSIKFHCYQ